MTDTATILDQYSAAFLERSPDKLVDLIAVDRVMEGTGPESDGNVWRGYDECLAGWQGLASDPSKGTPSIASTAMPTAGRGARPSQAWRDPSSIGVYPT